MARLAVKLFNLPLSALAPEKFRAQDAEEAAPRGQ